MEPNDGDSIKLTVPATAAAVRITRVGAAGVATRAGFTYREVEEVRLAGGLSVELRVEDETDRPTPISELAAAVLDASVDEWEASAADRRVVLHKHRPEVDDDDD